MMRRAVATILCGMCLLLLVACGQGGGSAGSTGGAGEAQAASAGTHAPDTPTVLHVTLPPVPSPFASPLYHPIDKTIRNAAAVQRLYVAMLAQPAAPKGIVSCPAEIPLTYHLVFLDGSRVLRTVDMEATGCRWLHLGPHDVRMPDAAFFTLFQRTLAL